MTSDARNRAAVLCPSCGSGGRVLLGEAWVDYHHCDSCRTTWLIDRRDPQSLPVLLATPKQDRRKAGR